MKSTDAVRKAMESAGFSQTKLAERMGYNSQGGISNALARKNGIRVDVFVKMMNILGYEVIVRRKNEEIEITE